MYKKVHAVIRADPVQKKVEEKVKTTDAENVEKEKVLGPHVVSLKFRVLNEAAEMLRMNCVGDVELILGKAEDVRKAHAFLIRATLPCLVKQISTKFLTPDKKIVDLHDVFHVSLRQPFVQSTDTPSSLPSTFRRHNQLDTPVRARDSRVVSVHGIPQEQWLVHWHSAKSASLTWEPVVWLQANFLHLHLEDKVNLMRGRVDTDLALNSSTQMQPKRRYEQAHKASRTCRESPSPLDKSRHLWKIPSIRKRSRSTIFHSLLDMFVR